jgi:hypothetical protein
MLNEELAARELPGILLADTGAGNWPQRRQELLELFAANEYGRTPEPPESVHAEVIKEELRAWAGKATHREVSLGFPTPKGDFSFPVDFVLPNTEGKLPFIVYISFHKYPAGEYTPYEEIVDNGYALATFCYNDVTRDADDGFTSGLAGMYKRSGDGAQWGKIGMWAWAASRVMDYAQTLGCIDHSRIACAGHSRLGKTALWCAVQDERFAAAVSNESGCGGAAISRGKQGESVRNITDRFPHWFCSNYSRYAGKEHEMPFDQHQLMAAIAPRLLYVSSAEEDLWSDPKSEFLACVEAGKAYRMLGMDGLVHEDRFPEPGECLHEGRIGYHLRPGTHFFSRDDWNLIMRFLDKHMGRPG